ncbi:hypothetical protein ACFQX7_32585 [Luedemannella flava]
MRRGVTSSDVPSISVVRQAVAASARPDRTVVATSTVATATRPTAPRRVSTRDTSARRIRSAGQIMSWRPTVVPPHRRGRGASRAPAVRPM